MIRTKKTHEQFDADDYHHSAASINSLKKYTSIVIVYIANMSKTPKSYHTTNQQINKHNMYLKYEDQSWPINLCNERLIAQAASFDSSTWYYDSFATPAPGIGEGWLGGRLCLWLIQSIGQTPRNMMITIGENWVVHSSNKNARTKGTILHRFHPWLEGSQVIWTVSLSFCDIRWS